MRICILGDATCIHTKRIAAALASRGHFVRAVSYKTDYIRGVRVEKFSVPRFSPRYPARWHRRLAMYLRRMVRGHDVVHVNFLNDWGITPEIADEGCLVVSPWGSDIVKPPDLDAYPNGLLETRRQLLRMADRIVVYGHPFIDVVAEFAGLGRDEITSVPLGVDVHAFTPLSEDKRRPATVGFFKGFRAVYGPTVWIEAMPQVLAAVPEARFDMVGDGPMFDECRALVRRLGVEASVNWVPRQPHEAVADMIGSWTLSVMPSMCEAFGVAALECAAMQTPVVASDVCGFHETVRDGETGLLVPPGNATQVAEAVIRLLKDGNLRARMGHAGRTMVEASFDWPDCVDQLLAAFESARHSRQPACAV